MIYLVVAVFFLHFISLPIVFGAELYVDSAVGAVVIAAKLFGIKVFVKRMKFSQLLDKVNKIGQRVDVDETVKKVKTHGFLRATAIRAVKLIRVRYIDIQSTIGTGDAASTAAVVGAVNIAVSQACAVFGYRDCVGRISPDFDNEQLYISFVGIFTLSFADIIYALFVAAGKSVCDKLAGRRKMYANNIAEWKGRTPDRANYGKRVRQNENSYRR